MHIHCLRSYLPIEQQTTLGYIVQRYNGWFQPHVIWVDYYIASTHAPLLYLVDGNLVRLHTLDYIV